MSWRQSFLKVLLSAGIALLIGAMCWRPALQADSASRPKVYVDDFGQSNVIGRIGAPLGRVVKITGRVADDDSRMKARDGKRVILIETVEGQRLKSPVVFSDDRVSVAFDRNQRTNDLLARTGSRFRVAAYETGTFTEWPEGDVYREAPQIWGFSYVSQLVIVHDFQNPADTKPVPSPFPKKS